jgi:hypothetical protein
MKRRGWIFFLAVAAQFISCPVEQAAEGVFVVQNGGYDENLEITEAQLKKAGSMEWVSRWRGSCAGNADIITELSFSAAPGVYDVRIKAAERGFIPRFYETGYLQPVKIGAGDCKYIVFDGREIYDAEKRR